MTTETTEATAAAATAEAAKAPTLKDLPQRRMFDTAADALTALQTILDTVTGAADLPLIVAGRDAEGGIDSSIYEGQRVMLALLNEKLPKPANGEGEGGMRPKAIVMTPLPTLEAILADKQGREWLAGVVDTQLNNTAFRKLRKPETVLSNAAHLLPVTLADYVTSEGAGANAGIMASFDALHSDVTKLLVSKSPRWAQGKPGKKAVLLQALESAAFASRIFPALEQSKAAPGGLFVLWLRLAINLAKETGKDPAIFQHWLDTRDQTTSGTDEEEELDFDSLLAPATGDAEADADAEAAGE